MLREPSRPHTPVQKFIWLNQCSKPSKTMRTMDQGQLQKLLSAAVSTPQTANPMMLFSPMTQTQQQPPAWPLKPQVHHHHPQSVTSPSNSLEANMAALQQLLFLQQALGSQQGLTVTMPPAQTPLPSSFSIPVMYTTVTTNTTSTTPVSTPVTPQCSSPSYPISALLQMQAQLEKSATPPVVHTPAPELLRKISTASMPSEYLPGSLPASSPSTSSSKKEEEDEEEEEEEFVDIESVDVAIDGKEKRKAHVEFYRRMKCMRQQDKVLSCGMCKIKVENQDNSIAAHVAEHADAGGYQCRLCGFQSTNKYKIYAHMRGDHPRKVDMFVDRRDMPKMCLILSQCFPKTTSRPKKESNRNADTYLTQFLKGCTSDRSCEVCKVKVRRDKTAMIRHVQNLHTYKCKTCKIVLTGIEDQIEHQKEAHQEKDPKMSVHYAPSAAAIYLLPALEKCFPMNI